MFDPVVEKMHIREKRRILVVTGFKDQGQHTELALEMVCLVTIPTKGTAVWKTVLSKAGTVD